ncbi:TRAP transporter small permease subunit [Silicimonas algicola]|uniref:TRAP transporter small permease protein n=1 Tax=Silicimonas algicola TaxID=1826607 RepID=A0A316G435_9RHOB|nr:TRAP transporter small permease subunit [Silicimonas algicola]AZQ67117.1 TRAP transporter small permease subunit [Silicimonas algicola]PWK55352.1 TRAP-type C4-dicarboxylate transport system permease small subunit [Silicimonas algicola]
MSFPFASWKRTVRAAADAVPAFLLAAMFVSFIIQVVMRYVVDSPVGWTVEVCVIAWLWIVLWGQSVSTSEDEEIRFDIIYGSVRPAVRRWFRVVFSAALVAIYGIALPANWDFVTFMKIQETSYLDLPFSWVFSVLIIFMVVSILRYLVIFWQSVRGREPGDDALSDRDLAG